MARLDICRHKLNKNAVSSKKSVVFTMRGIHCGEAAEIFA